MIDVGAAVPDARVFSAPGKAISVRDAAAGSKTILLFYLFDFSGT